MLSKLEEDFKEIRKVGTPWCAVRTTDYQSTIKTLLKVSTNDKEERHPAVIWDCINGPASAADTPTIGSSDDQPHVILNNAVNMLPEWAILFMVCPDNTLLENSFVVQAISNLRDAFKSNHRTLVLLGVNPRFTEFLSEDIPILDDPPPTEEELQSIVKSICEPNEIKLKQSDIALAADLCLGMARFPAEEAIARKLRKDGIDLKGLSVVRKNVIEASTNRALTWEKETWTFDQIGGLKAFKSFMTDIFGGPMKPKLVIRLDEIEKSISQASSGTVADNTGVSQDILKVILAALEDNGWMGLLAVGGPGCLHEDTPIFDPVDKTTKTVKTRCEEGKQFYVHAWNHKQNKPCIALAMPPRKYETATMMEVSFSSGEKITVTPHHKFWTGTSYVELKQILQSPLGFSAFPLPSISESCLLAHRQDVPHWSDRAGDCLSDCLSLSCYDGESLLLEEGSVLKTIPLPSGAPALSCCVSQHRDAADNRLRHSHSCLSAVPLSRTNCSCRIEPHSENEWECSLCEAQSVSECHCSSSCEQLRSQKNPLHKKQSPFVSSPQSKDSPHPLACDNSFTGTINYTTIVSVRRVESRPYYDFHVPIHNNYWACGAFHHNTGKTLASICTGNEFNVPTLAGDLGSLRGSLVGESEAKVRKWVEIIKAIGGKNVLFIATANRLDTLPPELQRRFWLGTWFWDSPDAEERKRIWEIQRERYQIAKEDKQPKDEEWVGSDIRNCCRLAWACGSTLQEASTRITLAAKSSKTSIESLRTLAEQSGFRCANKPGAYKRSSEAKGRKFSLEN